MYPGSSRVKTYNVYSQEQIERALRTSGLTIHSEIDSHFLIYCPFHFNTNTPAGEVDKTSGRFYCFACEATASLQKLLMKKGYTYFQAMRLIGDEDYNITQEIDRILDEKPEFVEFDQSVVERLHADIAGVGRKYLDQRGITDRSIARFQLGYSRLQRMVTIPVHSPTGTLLGFVGRSVQQKQFKNSTGLAKSRTLFNLHQVWTSNRVYVVESSFDAIRLDQVSAPAVATLGAGISNDQINLLRRTFDEIIIIPDNDPAGAGMVEKMSKSIPDLQVLGIPTVCKDIGDMSDEWLTTLLTTDPQCARL